MRFLSVCLFLGLCVISGWTAEVPSIPVNPAKSQAGLEGGKWKTEAWANQGAAAMVEAGEAKALKLSFTGGEKEKVAFGRQFSASLDPEGKVRLNVYSPDEKPPQVTVFLLTGTQGVWHEAKPFTVKQGWNECEVALAQPNWKTAATKWEFKAGIEHPDDIRGIGLIVMNGKASGWLAVQGLSLDSAKASKEVEAVAKKLLSEDGEERAKAEKELAAIGRPAIPALRRLKNNDRPEVALRAGWALDKIEADMEKERRAEESKNKEAKGFTEEKRRVESLLENLKGTRAKLQQLASDAREELLRAQKDAKDVKAPSEDAQKTYDELLKQLDEVSRETLRMVGVPETKTAGAEKKPE